MSSHRCSQSKGESEAIVMSIKKLIRRPTERFVVNENQLA